MFDDCQPEGEPGSHDASAASGEGQGRLAGADTLVESGHEPDGSQIVVAAAEEGEGIAAGMDGEAASASGSSAGLSGTASTEQGVNTGILTGSRQTSLAHWLL